VNIEAFVQFKKEAAEKVSAKSGTHNLKRRRPRTLSLDDTIFDAARLVAQKQNSHLSALVEDLLSEYLRLTSEEGQKGENIAETAGAKPNSHENDL
jgi:hypothetical protein